MYIFEDYPDQHGTPEFLASKATPLSQTDQRESQSTRPLEGGGGPHGSSLPAIVTANEKRDRNAENAPKMQSCISDG